MRKFYSVLLTALVGMVSLAANAINVTVNVDDPSRVSIKVNYTLVENIVAGDNQFAVDEYTTISMEANSGMFITKVVRSQEGAEDVEEYVNNMSSFTAYVSSYNEGAKWTVTSMNADEARDGSCRIYVDEASKVRVQYSGTYADVQLVDGWNDVKFMTEKELPLTIGPAQYGQQLYQVKVGGEVVAPEGTSWRITPSEGAEIEIFANFPDIDVPLTFTYANEEAKGFITGVLVNNEAVENYNEEGFTVKAGSQVTVNGNTSDYKLNSFKVNGNDVYFYGSYSFVVSEATTVSVDAKKYGTVKATLVVDNPDNIVVYKGYSYNNDIIETVEGENAIELSETNAMIQIKPVSGCFITSVTDQNGTPYTADYDGAYNITLTDGMVITIASGAIERNQAAMFYIDDRSAATAYFSFQRGDRSSVDVETGYNEIKFYDGDNPYGLSWYGAEFANVYKNGELVSPMYEGTTNYELTLADGDVVKVFLTCNPETYNVKFNVAEGVDKEKVAVTCDRIRNMEAWAEGFAVLQGTEVSIRPEEGYEIIVKEGENSVAAGEDGTFLFTVTAETTISLAVEEEGNGIRTINTVNGAESDVYNLQGVCVARKADTAKLNELPAGVYIVNGKKVVKR